MENKCVSINFEPPLEFNHEFCTRLCPLCVFINENRDLT